MRKRIIACVLACAMLLMGAGYAYWTDVTTMTAVVDAGEFNVDFVAAEKLGNNFDATNYQNTGWVTQGYDTEYGYYDKIESNLADPNVNDNLVNFSESQIIMDIKELYPGHAEYYGATVKNTGNVAAKIGKINSAITNCNDAEKIKIKDMLGIAIIAEQDGASTYHTGYWCGWNWVPVDVPVDFDMGTNKMPNEWVNLGIYKYGLDEDDYFFVDGIPYIRFSALQNINVDETSKNLYNILFVNEACDIDFGISVAMDPDAEGDYTTGRAEALKTANKDEWSEDGKATLTLDFVWDQYNEIGN